MRNYIEWVILIVDCSLKLIVPSMALLLQQLVKTPRGCSLLFGLEVGEVLSLLDFIQSVFDELRDVLIHPLLFFDHLEVILVYFLPLFFPDVLHHHISLENLLVQKRREEHWVERNWTGILNASLSLCDVDSLVVLSL